MVLDVICWCWVLAIWHKMLQEMSSLWQCCPLQEKEAMKKSQCYWQFTSLWNWFILFSLKSTRIVHTIVGKRFISSVWERSGAVFRQLQVTWQKKKVLGKRGVLSTLVDQAFSRRRNERNAGKTAVWTVCFMMWFVCKLEQLKSQDFDMEENSWDLFVTRRKSIALIMQAFANTIWKMSE